ncbi:unnamed protein product [Ectocarpus sp. CCAP 1310/34]|nr:unnamed protein product [Ectocarpus sp. CCAP 1310/34]
MDELSTGGDESAARAMSGEGEVLTERPREEGKKRSGGDVEVGDSRQTREVLSKNVQQTSEDAQRTEAEVSGGKCGWPEGKRRYEGIAHAGGGSVSQKGEGLTERPWEEGKKRSGGDVEVGDSRQTREVLSKNVQQTSEDAHRTEAEVSGGKGDGGGKVPMKEEEKRKRGPGAQVEEDGRGSSASDEGGGGDGESLGGQPPGGGKVEMKGERGAQ